MIPSMHRLTDHIDLWLALVICWLLYSIAYHSIGIIQTRDIADKGDDQLHSAPVIGRRPIDMELIRDIVGDNELWQSDYLSEIK